MSVHRICEFGPFWTKKKILQKDTHSDGNTHRRRRSNSSLDLSGWYLDKISVVYFTVPEPYMFADFWHFLWILEYLNSGSISSIFCQSNQIEFFISIWYNIETNWGFLSMSKPYTLYLPSFLKSIDKPLIQSNKWTRSWLNHMAIHFLYEIIL